MSISIYWKPSAEGAYLDCQYTTADAQKLKLPRTFARKDLEYLQGYCDASGSQLADKIINLIIDHESIDVWSES